MYVQGCVYIFNLLFLKLIFQSIYHHLYKACTIVEINIYVDKISQIGLTFSIQLNYTFGNSEYVSIISIKKLNI